MREMPAAMREKVMLVADLFAERGFDSTKMEDVAAATGVPKATLYYYFESKEEILGFLFTAILDKVTEAIGEAVAEEGSAAERLAAAVAVHLKIMEEFPAASQTLQFDLGRAARIPDIAEKSKSAFIQPVHDLLLEGAADGSLSQVRDPWVVATAILGAITTAGMNFVAVPHAKRTKRTTTELVSFLLNGVSA